MKRGQACCGSRRRVRHSRWRLFPSREAGNAFIAFGSDAGRKRDRGVHPNLVSPRGADPRQIVREDERGAGSIGAMDRNDGLVGQRKTRTEIANRRGVPFGDLAEIDVRKHRSGQSKLSRTDAFDVDHRRHAADDDRVLNEAQGGQFVRTQRRIGGAEIHGPALDLPDADARSDGLVVDRDPGHGLEGFRPFGQNRVHERRTGSQHSLREGWRTRARPAQHRGDDQRGKGLVHERSPYDSISPDRWSSALARSRRRSGRSDARLAAELQTRWRFSGELLRVVFFNRTHSRWLFDRRPLARSADDVVRALEAGGKEQAARMSRQKVARYAHRERRAHDQWVALPGGALSRLITSSKLAVRGHSGPTQQRRASLGCARSRCVPLFAISWRQEQAAGPGPSSLPRSTLSPLGSLHRAVRYAVNWPPGSLHWVARYAVNWPPGSLHWVARYAANWPLK